MDPELETQAISKIQEWRQDWCLFASEALGANLDPEQQAILRSVQVNRMTAVASGTARGKDFVTAVACICFMYLTPEWDENEVMVKNTKVAMTAPTDRQVKNIMMPEISRLFYAAHRRGVALPGKLNAYDIRTESEEWFLVGFKASEHNHESWSGFHAVNTMFAVTEASGISDDTFAAIEGNLQGNSRLLIVFNPNTTIGYAAAAMKQKRFTPFTLSSLSAPNVVQRKIVIPGQVDFDWMKDKVDTWSTPIDKADVRLEEDDFEFDGNWYRPNDLFRIKVLGKFPKVDSDVIIPEQWIEAANERWLAFDGDPESQGHLKLGVDVAGQGRDSSCFFGRRGNYTELPKMVQSGGEFMHMEIAGRVKHILDADGHAMAFIDTIGEGAGVYARLKEQGVESAVSAKFSHGAIDPITGYTLTDITEEHQFLNMRAYLYWALKDWLNPQHNPNAMLPPDEELKEELTNTKWKFNSQGKIQIEAKEDIKKRIGRSPDKADALVNTFYPEPPKAQQLSQYF